MKKILAMILAVIMVMSLACMASAEEVKTYKVGCSIYTFDDNFMTLYRNEIEAYFKTLFDLAHELDPQKRPRTTPSS